MRYKEDRHIEQHSPFKMNSVAAEVYRETGANDGCAELTMMDDAKEIAEGNLSSVEARLVSQAVALDTIFTTLAVRAHTAMSYSSEGLEGAERYLRLALKAQAQSANTMKILAEIKQPKSIMIAKQANIARNQIVTANPPNIDNYARGNFQAGDQTEKNTNELIQIGDIQHATLDSRSTQTAFRVDESQDQAMGAVATVNRGKNYRG